MEGHNNNKLIKTSPQVLYEILIWSTTAGWEHLAIIEPKSNICGDRRVPVPTGDLMGLPRTNYAYQYVGEPPFGHGHNSNNRKRRAARASRGGVLRSAGGGLRAFWWNGRIHCVRMQSYTAPADLHSGTCFGAHLCSWTAIFLRWD